MTPEGDKHPAPEKALPFSEIRDPKKILHEILGIELGDQSLTTQREVVPFEDVVCGPFIEKLGCFPLLSYDHRNQGLTLRIKLPVLWNNRKLSFPSDYEIMQILWDKGVSAEIREKDILGTGFPLKELYVIGTNIDIRINIHREDGFKCTARVNSAIELKQGLGRGLEALRAVLALLFKESDPPPSLRILIQPPSEVEEPPEKPIASLPIRFEIENAETLYRVLSGSKRVYIEVLQELGVSPLVKMTNLQEILLEIPVPASAGIKKIENIFTSIGFAEKARLEKLMRTLIDPKLSASESFRFLDTRSSGFYTRSENLVIWTYCRDSKLPYLRQIPIAGIEKQGDNLTFIYQSRGVKVDSPENLARALRFGLALYGVYLSELLKANDIPLPKETIPVRLSTQRVRIREGGVSSVDSSLLVEEDLSVRFEDIGGQEQAVEEARLLSEQLKNPEVFSKWGVEPPRGIIFYGPPGTGKTEIARAIASNADAIFLHVKMSDIVSKWYGESDKKAVKIFDDASKLVEETGRHCILFLDEVDSIMQSRETIINEATRRILAGILLKIDGIGATRGITVIASTNRLEDVDRAFLSRMTKWVEVPLPDAKGLAEIFAIHFRKASIRAGRELMETGVDFQKLAAQSVGLSGRDVRDIVEMVITQKALKELSTGESSLVSEEDIHQAVGSSDKFRSARKDVSRKRGLGFSSL